MFSLRNSMLMALAWLAVGCGASNPDARRTARVSAETGSASVPAFPNETLPPTDGTMSFVGRTLPLDINDPSHVRFSWASVGVGMHFNGTGLSVALDEIPASYMGHTGDVYYDLTVDGTQTTFFHTTSTPTVYTLAEGLPPGEHTVWITKRTESMIGSGELRGVAVKDGQLLDPPPHAARTIEVIGASADVGYGVETTQCAGYRDSEENGNKAWPSVAAEQLGAEVHQLSCSGKGIVANIDGSTTELLPEAYLDADFNVPGSPWDLDGWKPDVVVLDNGANDFSGAKNVLTPGFVAAYVHFIESIAQHAPQATIYVVVNATQTGTLRAALVTTMQEVVSKAQAAGVTGAQYFEFPQYTSSVFGCDGHPSADLHATMGHQIAAQIAKDLDWN